MDRRNVGTRYGVEEERGFLLLETLFCGMLLVAILAALTSFPRAERIDRMEGLRQQADFLARGEWEAMKLEMAEGRIHAGRYGWLGEEQDLYADEKKMEDVRFDVVADVGEISEERSYYPLRIIVNWTDTSTGKSDEVQLEGRLSAP